MSDTSNAGDFGAVGTVGTTSPTPTPAPLGLEWTGPEGQRQIRSEPRWTDSAELRRARATASGEDPAHRAAASGDRTTDKTDAAVVDPAKITEKLRLRDNEGREFELDGNDVQRLTESHAAELLRKANTPATAGDYKLELPKEFKTPDGIEYRINPQDPSYADVRAWAHGRPQHR